MATDPEVFEPADSGESDRIWTVRDIIRAVPLSFDAEKLLTAGAGLFTAALIFGLAHWLGLKTGQRPAHRVFTILGTIAASCVWVLFAGIISKMSLTQLLERRKAGAAEIREFVRDRWSTLLGTPMAFGTLALLFVGVMALIELVGAVPGIGPIVFSAAFLLVFILAFLAMLTILIHTLGTFLYPSIIALRGVGAGGVLMEMFELVRRKGFLLLLYEAVAGLVGLVMTGVIGVLVWAGLYLSNWTALAVMKEEYEQSLEGMPEFFRVFLRPFERWLPYVPEPMEVVWHYDLSGLLLGVSLLCIVVATAVYPFVFFNTAGSITYLILRGDRGAGAARS